MRTSYLYLHMGKESTKMNAEAVRVGHLRAINPRLQVPRSKCQFDRTMETKMHFNESAWRSIKHTQQGLGPSFLHTTHDNGARTDSHPQLVQPIRLASGAPAFVGRALNVSFSTPVTSSPTCSPEDFFFLFSHTERWCLYCSSDPNGLSSNEPTAPTPEKEVPRLY